MLSPDEGAKVRSYENDVGIPATVTAAPATSLMPCWALARATFTAFLMMSVVASGAVSHVSAVSNEAMDRRNTASFELGPANTTVGPDASLSGVPLHQSDAICSSANPRIRYISPMSVSAVGRTNLFALIAC